MIFGGLFVALSDAKPRKWCSGECKIEISFSEFILPLATLQRWINGFHLTRMPIGAKTTAAFIEIINRAGQNGAVAAGDSHWHVDY